MIIQRLCECYDKNVRAGLREIPPVGYENKYIPFVIVLDDNGCFVMLEDHRGSTEKKTFFVVPKSEARRGKMAYMRPNCLWDHLGYVLAQPRNADPYGQILDKEILLAKLQHEAFVSHTANIARITGCHEVAIVLKFLNNPKQIELVKSVSLFREAMKIIGCNISFRIKGLSHLVCQSINVTKWINSQQEIDPDLFNGICLVTGKRDRIARLHGNITGVTDIPTPLVSFNDESCCSYLKEQGFNSPVGFSSAQKYMTVLNYLLKNDSKNKIIIGKLIVLFWSSEFPGVEAFLSKVLSCDDGFDIDSYLSFKSNCQSIKLNVSSPSINVLGVSPNSNRISIRLWYDGHTTNIINHLFTWIDDIYIDGFDKKCIPSVRALLSHAASFGQDKNIELQLSVNVIRSILDNNRLPDFLLTKLLEVIRSEHGIVSQYRAALAKAWLNATYRFQGERTIESSLDEDEHRAGYMIGRLFSLLERLEHEVTLRHPRVFSNFYLVRACYAPNAIFPMLLAKRDCYRISDSGSLFVAFINNEIDSILNIINDFPCSWGYEQKALFIVGYYQQKQELKRRQHADK